MASPELERMAASARTLEQARADIEFGKKLRAEGIARREKSKIKGERGENH